MLVEFLTGQRAEITACVATEYGEALLNPAENLKILVGRMSEPEIEALLRTQNFDLLLDATHPYAREVTENLVESCAKTATEYLRVLREEGSRSDQAVTVRSVQEAAEFLGKTEGKILLTTGSKEISAFSGIPDFRERVCARVLPMSESLELCEKAGVLRAHILAMQGPFSTEMNVAQLHMTGAKWLVTKESGGKGGFEEKLAAAKIAGATPVIIGRPTEESGKTFAETLSLLGERFGFSRKPQVSVVGIGPGNPDFLTVSARNAIRSADCLIGAARMLEQFGETPRFAAIKPEEIAEIIRNHPEYAQFAVLMSGDTGFYSGTKKLLPLLSDCAVEVCPGISSMQYLCGKLGKDWQDVRPVSLHGREQNLAGALRKNKRIFVLVGGENGIGRLCERLCNLGFPDAVVSVGEQLSYSDEKITIGTAEELRNRPFARLSAALVETKEDSVASHGLPDEAFQRSQEQSKPVPMTKREVRSVAISMLSPHRDSICWDIGAGTGSVSIELALLAEIGQVYAVERRSEALSLLEENKRKFAVENLTVIPGFAPECCRELPKPSHVFIGGSSGNLPEIVECILSKNPEATIVATAIALETVAQLTALRSRFWHSEVVCLTAARDRKVGGYALMTGQNPVYIFTFKGEKRE